TSYDGHLDAQEFLGVLDRLRRQGSIHSDTLIATTHHSHNGDATHEELVSFCAPHGVTVGYDGLVIEL
ncbi:hypothetical protein ABTH41_19675, partial [Acinetobacter baumannii]